MVTKVVTANDVDNVTIVINGENKLQAKLPATTPSEVVIEEVPDVTTANAVVTVNGVERKITKLGKVNGTDWLVFQLGLPTNISVECGKVYRMSDHFLVETPPVVRVTTPNMGGKTPQTVKFDVNIFAETRTYSYPYSESNEYVWNNFADFTYNPAAAWITFSAASIVFTDGSSTTPSSSSICTADYPRD